MKQPVFPVKVFYDGACPVCSAEIGHYLRHDHGGRLDLVDISAADFDPRPYGITLTAFMAELHVIDQAGEIYRGIAAFQAIWQAFPDASVYRFLEAAVNLPLINPVARLLYKGFAAIRPRLPGRHVCTDGTCRSGRH